MEKMWKNIKLWAGIIIGIVVVAAAYTLVVS